MKLFAGKGHTIQNLKSKIQNGIVAVWEFTDRKWKLLQIERLTRAIALYQQSPAKRLIFPTDINLSRASDSTDQQEPLIKIVEPSFSTSEISEQIRILIAKSPGISTRTVATRLDISWTTARKYLRQLESEQKICCQLSAWDGKSHTYHPVKQLIPLVKESAN